MIAVALSFHERNHEYTSILPYFSNSDYCSYIVAWVIQEGRVIMSIVYVTVNPHVYVYVHVLYVYFAIYSKLLRWLATRNISKS